MGPIQLRKAVHPVGYGGHRGGFGRVGDVDYLNTVIVYAGHHRVRPAGYLGYPNTLRAVQLRKAIHPVGYGGHRDWPGWEGNGNYLYTIITLTDHYCICPTGYLGYPNTLRAVQLRKAVHPVGYGGHRGGFGRVGDVDYLYAVINWAGHHRVRPAGYLGYLYGLCTVQLRKAVHPVGYGGHRGGFGRVGDVDYLNTVIVYAGHHRVRPAGYLNRFHTVGPIQLRKAVHPVGHGGHRDKFDLIFRGHHGCAGDHERHQIFKHTHVRPVPPGYYVAAGPDRHPAAPFRVVVDHDHRNIQYSAEYPVLVRLA